MSVLSLLSLGELADRNLRFQMELLVLKNATELLETGRVVDLVVEQQGKI